MGGTGLHADSIKELRRASIVINHIRFLMNQIAFGFSSGGTRFVNHVFLYYALFDKTCSLFPTAKVGHH
jgi:hypothetical protein